MIFRHKKTAIKRFLYTLFTCRLSFLQRREPGGRPSSLTNVWIIGIAEQLVKHH